MDFNNGVKNIQTAGYNGAHTVNKKIRHLQNRNRNQNQNRNQISTTAIMRIITMTMIMLFYDGVKLNLVKTGMNIKRISRKFIMRIMTRPPRMRKMHYAVFQK